MGERDPRPGVDPLAFPGAVALLVFGGFLATVAAAHQLLERHGQGLLEVERKVLATGGGFLPLLALALLLRRDPRFPWRIAPRRLLHAVAVYTLCLVPWFVFASTLHPWLMELLGQPAPVQEQLRYFGEPHPHGATFALMLGIVCVVGPVAEEVLFRGFVHNALERILGVRLALVLGAALFGLLHGLPFALPLALLGLLFGWLRVRYGSLAAPALAHALHNSLTVLLTSVNPEWILGPGLK